MRVLVTGDRNWTNYEEVARTLLELKRSYFGWPTPEPVMTIIHGAARGADEMAGQVANTFRGFSEERYPADWKGYGKGAGPIRNQQMLMSKPDLVVAFHGDLENSKGTKDMVGRAIKAGIPIIYVEGRQDVSPM